MQPYLRKLVGLTDEPNQPPVLFEVFAVICFVIAAGFACL